MSYEPQNVLHASSDTPFSMFTCGIASQADLSFSSTFWNSPFRSLQHSEFKREPNILNELYVWHRVSRGIMYNGILVKCYIIVSICRIKNFIDIFLQNFILQRIPHNTEFTNVESNIPAELFMEFQMTKFFHNIFGRISYTNVTNLLNSVLNRIPVDVIP